MSSMIDDAMYEAAQKRRDKRKMLESTKRAGVGGGLAGIVSGIGTSLAGGQKSLSGLVRNAATHGAIGAGLGAGSQYIGQNIAGPVGDEENGGHANRGALGGAVAGGLGGLALGGLLGAGKLGWLKKAQPMAESLLGKNVFDNIAADHLKKMLAEGKAGPLAAALGIGGGLVGGAQGWGEGVDADYTQSLERDDER